MRRLARSPIARPAALAAAIACLVSGSCSRSGGSTTESVPAFAPGSTVPGYVARVPLLGVGDVRASGSLQGGVFETNDTVPGSRLTFPTGSAADVAAIGTYDGGEWVVVMERRLDTGDAANDVRFEAGGTYYFQVATFDNEGGAAEAIGMTGASADVYSIVLPASLPGPVVVQKPVNLLSLEGEASAERLRLVARFADQNNVANAAPGSWIFDGTAWKRTTGDQDRLAFYWSLEQGVPLGSGPGTTGTGTCATMCHTGVGEWTLAGKVDAWEWRAGTTDPVGALADGVVDSTDGGGRKADPGRVAPSSNVNDTATAPAVMGEFDPGSRAAAVLDVPSGARRAVAFDPGAAFARGDRVPGFVATPISGSFGDVAAEAGYENGVWTVTLERSLATADPDHDVQFEAGRSYAFQVAIFDNEPGFAEAFGMTSESDQVFFVTLPMTPGPLAFSRTPKKLASLAGETTGDGKIRFRAAFADANRRRDASREPWIFDGAAWTRSLPLEADEDRLAFLFAREPDVPLGTGPGTTGTGTCVIMCHTGEGMRTASGSVDLWEWAASSTNPVGAAADGSIGTGSPGFSGRLVDSGSGGPRPNADLSGTLPQYMAGGDPGRRAEALLAPNFATLPLTTPLPAGVERAIPFGQAEWTVTFRRSLRTTDPERDAQFVADGVTPHFFQVATFDNETGRAQNVGMTEGADQTFPLVIPVPDGLPGLQDLVFPSLPAKLTHLSGTFDDAATPGDPGDDGLSITVRFRDASNRADRRRNEWAWDGRAWSRGAAGSEDMVALYFALDPGLDIGNGPGTTGTGTCATMCHADRGEWTDAGRLDSWLWAAARTDPSGFAEDQHLDSTEGNGRHPDAGTSSYAENRDTLGLEPVEQADADPDSNALHLRRAGAEVERAVPFSETGFVAGSTVPGFVLESGYGSRADVRATASHDAKSRRWTLTMTRAALTPDATSDVQFLLGGSVSFQVTRADDTSLAAADEAIPDADLPVTMALPASGDFRGRTELPILFSRLPAALVSLEGVYHAGSTPSDPVDDFVSLEMTWSDPTDSRDGSRWRKNDSGTWSRLDPAREDRLALVFSLGNGVPLGTGPGTTGTGTCATMCHAGGSAFSAASGSVDAWSWSSSRFAAHAFLDDGRVDSIGPSSDAGGALAAPNANDRGDRPAFQGEGGPATGALAIASWVSGTRAAVPFVATVDRSKYGDGGGSDAVTYSRTVRPIINSNCACHLNGQVSGGLNMDSYDNLLRGGQNNAAFPAVIPFDGAASLVYRKVSEDRPPVGQRMPLGGPFLTTDDQLKIKEWIDQGALDN